MARLDDVHTGSFLAVCAVIVDLNGVTPLRPPRLRLASAVRSPRSCLRKFREHGAAVPVHCRPSEPGWSVICCPSGARSRQLASYREHRARVERDAVEAVEAERLRCRHGRPDPATVLSIATGPRRRLWERRHTDPDYLLLRAGTADLPSAVELTDPAADEHRRSRFWLSPDSPVTIHLTERAVVGAAGPAGVPRAVARWLVAQIAVLHSPDDVQICILTDSTGRDAWAWARWLPTGETVFRFRPPGSVTGSSARTRPRAVPRLRGRARRRRPRRRRCRQRSGRPGCLPGSSRSTGRPRR